MLLLLLVVALVAIGILELVARVVLELEVPVLCLLQDLLLGLRLVVVLEKILQGLCRCRVSDGLLLSYSWLGGLRQVESKCTFSSSPIQHKLALFSFCSLVLELEVTVL